MRCPVAHVLGGKVGSGSAGDTQMRLGASCTGKQRYQKIGEQQKHTTPPSFLLPKIVLSKLGKRLMKALETLNIQKCSHSEWY